MEFNGAGQGLFLNTPLDMSEAYVHCVLRGRGYLVANSNDYRIAIHTPNDNFWWTTTSSTNAFAAEDTNIYDSTTTQITAFNKSTTTASLWVDGVQDLTIANTDGFKMDRIGFKWSGSTSIISWLGIIAEMVITSSNTDQLKIEGYKAHKWGLTGSLDGAHPYKTTAPTV